MKVCKDGRIWGQNNKEAGDHLGIPSPENCKGIKKGTASESKKGNKNPFYGRHHSEETKEKIRKPQSGSKHYNWKGGISLKRSKVRMQIEYRLWREAVLARDNWTCQECKKQRGRLESHHIKSLIEYPELRYAIDNGKTLCFECHKLTKNYGGRLNKRNGSNS